MWIYTIFFISPSEFQKGKKYYRTESYYRLYARYTELLSLLNHGILRLNPEIESLNPKIESLNHKIESLNPEIESLNHRLNH